MNIFVLSEALLLFDRKIHMENSSIKRVLCAGEGDHLNIFIRVTYLQAQALRNAFLLL